MRERYEPSPKGIGSPEIIMMDIHTHILPGVDDGAANMAEALGMARMAAKDGTTHMIATPHAFDGIFNSDKEQILEGCRELNIRLKAERIPLIILPGQEVRLTPELIDHIDNGAILTLNNTTCILIELPWQIVPGVFACGNARDNSSGADPHYRPSRA